MRPCIIKSLEAAAAVAGVNALTAYVQSLLIFAIASGELSQHCWAATGHVLCTSKRINLSILAQHTASLTAPVRCGFSECDTILAMPVKPASWLGSLFDSPCRRRTLQATTMDFYNMDDSERKRWLDDGLHFTEFGYDVLGRAIARAIDRNLVERR
jgi:hypothetical protein